MKSANLIALAVPVFLVMMLAEWLLLRREEDPGFELADSLSNLGCGILNQIFSVLFAATFAAAYLALARIAPIHFSAKSWPAWVLAFLGIELGYYWWHRLSHTVNFLWAIHVVHHQSRRYNLTVALRQATFSMATAWVFYLPLALMGVPAPVTLAMSSISTLYQFWIHTRGISRLGALEAFLNTPSHHRVHHGINPKYIDKNYGGVLINWDKLFGTFQEEEEEPSYGITTPFLSKDPLWANFHYWFELAELSAKAKSRRDALKVWVMFPGWKPEGVEAGAKDPAPDPLPAGGREAVAAVGIAAAIVALTGLYHAPRAQVWANAAAIIAGVLATGWLLDSRTDASAGR